MKPLLILILSIAAFCTGCGKEFSYENKVVEGTLKDSFNTCLSINSSGTYKRDVALNDSNYLLVQVRITRRGNYGIKTNLQNGMSFSDTGYITEGLKTLKLKGTGRPILAQPTTFKISFGTDTCTYTIPVASGLADPSVFTFEGSPNKCADAKVEGTYKFNTPLVLANKVIIQVNVVTTGVYTIFAAANGMSFSTNGNFTSTGIKQITLQGSGNPTASGNTTFIINGSSSQCSFNINVEPLRNSAINKADTAWSFISGNTKFFGPFDQAYTSGSNGSVFLYLKGITVFGDSAMSISIQLKGSTVDTGTYYTRTNPHFTYKDRYSLTTSIYRADPSTSNVEMKVVVTDYNPVTGLINGTFSGTAESAAGVVNITSGKFKAEVN